MNYKVKNLDCNEFFPCNKVTLNSYAVLHYYLILIETGQNSNCRPVLKEYEGFAARCSDYVSKPNFSKVLH